MKTVLELIDELQEKYRDLRGDDCDYAVFNEVCNEDAKVNVLEELKMRILAEKISTVGGVK